MLFGGLEKLPQNCFIPSRCDVAQCSCVTSQFKLCNKTQSPLKNINRSFIAYLFEASQSVKVRHP